MDRRILVSIIGLVVAIALVGVALAQEAEGPPPDDAGAADENATQAPATVDESAPQAPAPAIFVELLYPADEDVEVPLSVASLTLRGMTLPGAVVSVDGELARVDEQGVFTAEVPLEEGASAIDIVASDADGNLAETTVFVVRGE
ncbi:MAG: hypothetical protein HY690_08070 [Chloroflexi bacterium]|nr:hypothetical protein [Chloroflexota bacterium]